MPELDWPPLIGGGLVGILLTALLFVVRLWVNDMRSDRDFWRAMALGSLTVAEKGTTIAEQVVKNGTP